MINNMILKGVRWTGLNVKYKIHKNYRTLSNAEQPPPFHNPYLWFVYVKYVYNFLSYTKCLTVDLILNIITPVSSHSNAGLLSA